MAGLFGGFEEVGAQRAGIAQVLNSLRAANPMELGSAALLVFRVPEPGQHLIKRPAGIAEFRPVVIVLAVTTAVAHRID